MYPEKEYCVRRILCNFFKTPCIDVSYIIIEHILDISKIAWSKPTRFHACLLCTPTEITDLVRNVSDDLLKWNDHLSLCFSFYQVDLRKRFEKTGIYSVSQLLHSDHFCVIIIHFFFKSNTYPRH